MTPLFVSTLIVAGLSVYVAWTDLKDMLIENAPVIGILMIAAAKTAFLSGEPISASALIAFAICFPISFGILYGVCTLLDSDNSNLGFAVGLLAGFGALAGSLYSSASFATYTAQDIKAFYDVVTFLVSSFLIIVFCDLVHNGLGGGDIKYLSVMSLWFGFDAKLYSFFILFALFGAAFAAITWAAIRLRDEHNVQFVDKVLPFLKGQTKDKTKIPYAVSMAPAAILLMFTNIDMFHLFQGI